jgi:hypothetical protein
VTELEAVTPLRWKHAEKGGKAVCIGLKVGWQLEKNRTNLVAKQLQAIFHQLEAIDRVCREPLPMGDKL